MATDLTRSTRYSRARNFDRDAEFVVLRPLTVGGVDLRPGDPFDKSRASLRTHQLLFAQRKIDEVGGVWHKISGLPYPDKGAVKNDFVPPDVSDPPFAVPQKAKRGRPAKQSARA